MNTISSISYLHLNNYREENENCTCIAFHHLPRHHHHHHRHHHYYLLHSIENGGTTQPWHCIASHCHQPRPSVISTIHQLGKGISIALISAVQCSDVLQLQLQNAFSNLNCSKTLTIVGTNSLIPWQKILHPTLKHDARR